MTCTAATGLFCWGGKIDSRLLKFCQSHVTPLSGMAKCDLAKFKQAVITFCLLVKIVRPRQCCPIDQVKQMTYLGPPLSEFGSVITLYDRSPRSGIVAVDFSIDPNWVQKWLVAMSHLRFVHLSNICTSEQRISGRRLFEWVMQFTTPLTELHSAFHH